MSSLSLFFAKGKVTIVVSPFPETSEMDSKPDSPEPSSRDWIPGWVSWLNRFCWCYWLYCLGLYQIMFIRLGNWMGLQLVVDSLYLFTGLTPLFFLLPPLELAGLVLSLMSRMQSGPGPKVSLWTVGSFLVLLILSIEFNVEIITSLLLLMSR